VGGVATAARLAKAGFDVAVLEKNGFTGGRCSLIHHGSYVRAVSQLTITVSIDIGPDCL
jgi:phytoene dehydrogenase-like protein